MWIPTLTCMIAEMNEHSGVIMSNRRENTHCIVMVGSILFRSVSQSVSLDPCWGHFRSRKAAVVPDPGALSRWMGIKCLDGVWEKGRMIAPSSLLCTTSAYIYILSAGDSGHADIPILFCSCLLWRVPPMPVYDDHLSNRMTVTCQIKSYRLCQETSTPSLDFNLLCLPFLESTGISHSSIIFSRNAFYLNADVDTKANAIANATAIFLILRASRPSTSPPIFSMPTCFSSRKRQKSYRSTPHTLAPMCATISSTGSTKRKKAAAQETTL